MDYGKANKAGQVDGSGVLKILQTVLQTGMKTLDPAVAYGSSGKYWDLLVLRDFKL